MMTLLCLRLLPAPLEAAALSTPWRQEGACQFADFVGFPGTITLRQSARGRRAHRFRQAAKNGKNGGKRLENGLETGWKRLGKRLETVETARSAFPPCGVA